MRIWRCDLTKQTEPLIDELMQVTKEILMSGRYVLGEKLVTFEKEFAAYCETRFCVGVASGTEALYLALMALDIKSGDEVITTPFTAIPTFSAILMTGATPVLADIDPLTFNIRPEEIRKKITPKTKAIMPVHLFGQMANMDEIVALAQQHNIHLIEDAAQAHGSKYKGKLSGAFGIMSCYSFYPTKNLGACGDAGAIVTNDQKIYDKLKLLRNYGQESLYRTIINGVNSRLDELQAAYLSIKLKHLNAWNLQRTKLAALYEKNLPAEYITPPAQLAHTTQNYHVYVVRAQHRDRLQSYLETKGIQTNVYYPVPLHLQKSNTFLGLHAGDLPVAEKASLEVLALPMYPEMSENIVLEVCDEIRNFYKTT